MKSFTFLFFLLLGAGVISCKKDGNLNNYVGLNFCGKVIDSEIIVKYNDILGYDSTKHIFRITQTAWDRIKSKISPVYPDPHFEFVVILNNQVIYSAKYIPGYYSKSDHENITFILGEPNLVYIELGYPSPYHFSGIDYRNDSRIIAHLKKDSKLIEIEG
jgi:hypothetical protein